MHTHQSRKPAGSVPGGAFHPQLGARPRQRPRAMHPRQAAAASHCEQRRQHAPRQDAAPRAQHETTSAARRRGRAFRADRAASPNALPALGWLAQNRSAATEPPTHCCWHLLRPAGSRPDERRGSELRGACEPAPLPLSLQASTCELRLQCEARRRHPVRGRWGAAHRRRILAPARRFPARRAHAIIQLHARAAVEEACASCHGARSASSWGSPAPPARRRA